MKKCILAVSAILSATLTVSTFVPRKANFPDIPGYVVLKGDFHVRNFLSAPWTPITVTLTPAAL